MPLFVADFFRTLRVVLQVFPVFRVKGGRSPAQRTLDTKHGAVRVPMAGCGALSHSAMGAYADGLLLT